MFARGGSKGVPGKNLRPVGGIPLVGAAVQVARACPGIDRVLVSTDDDAIAEVARSYGAERPWPRPAHLAADDAPELEAWRHAVERLRRTPGGIGTLVSVPPTAPLRRPEDVEGALARYREGDVDVVVTATPARRHPGFNMVRLDERGHAHLVDPAGDARRRQDAPSILDLSTVAYVADPDFVLRTRHLLAGRVGVHVVSERSAWDVDTELDLRIAQLLAGDEAAGVATSPSPR